MSAKAQPHYAVTHERDGSENFEWFPTKTEAKREVRRRKRERPGLLHDIRDVDTADTCGACGVRLDWYEWGSCTACADTPEAVEAESEVTA